MRRHSKIAAAVSILSILVVVAVTQASSLSHIAIGEGVSMVQGDRMPLTAVGQSVAIGKNANAQADGRADSLLAAELPPPSPTLTAATPTKSPVQSAAGTTQSTQSPTNPVARHIGLQAGHWKYSEAPAPLNTMTGTSGGGKTEPEVTLYIANEVARILRSLGHTVDILPTVIPRGYKADLFVSIHADGSTNLGARGFFTDHPEGSPVAAAEARLSTAIDAEYTKATGIPYVNRSTPGSHYYYGYREVASTVPRVLIETGFLTNATDREILVNQPKRSAQGIADGIGRYLSQ